MRQEVHLLGGAGARRPAEIAALPDIYLFGGKGRHRARRPSQTREENQATGLGPPGRFRESPPSASRPPGSIGDFWGQPCSLRVLVGASVASPCAPHVPSWSDPLRALQCVRCEPEWPDTLPTSRVKERRGFRKL